VRMGKKWASRKFWAVPVALAVAGICWISYHTAESSRVRTLLRSGQLEHMWCRVPAGAELPLTECEAAQALLLDLIRAPSDYEEDPSGPFAPSATLQFVTKCDGKVESEAFTAEVYLCFAYISDRDLRKKKWIDSPALCERIESLRSIVLRDGRKVAPDEDTEAQ